MSLLYSLLNQNNLLDPFGGFQMESSDAQMDWKETPHAHIFEIDLPGFTKEEVKLEVHEGSVLQISTTARKEEGEEKGEKWHCKERALGGFSRRFRLPENSKIDEIKASMSDGVLVVTVPKDETKKKAKNKAVEIDGDDGERHVPKGLGRFVCCKA